MFVIRIFIIVNSDFLDFINTENEVMKDQKSGMAELQST
jgi:hypothetical protein